MTPVFSRARRSPDHRRAASVRHYARGETIFEQGTASDAFYTIASGRVKIFKMMPTRQGHHPRGLRRRGPARRGGGLRRPAVPRKRGRPRRHDLRADSAGGVFRAARAASRRSCADCMLGLTVRLVELTNRLAELSGGRIEPRFARLFVKLAGEMGRPGRGGTFIPLALSRQELADMTGTTIETCIRIMSRWGKQDDRPDRQGRVRRSSTSARARSARAGMSRMTPVMARSRAPAYPARAWTHPRPAISIGSWRWQRSSRSAPRPG